MIFGLIMTNDLYKSHERTHWAKYFVDPESGDLKSAGLISRTPSLTCRLESNVGRQGTDRIRARRTKGRAPQLRIKAKYDFSQALLSANRTNSYILQTTPPNPHPAIQNPAQTPR